MTLPPTRARAACTALLLLAAAAASLAAQDVSLESVEDLITASRFTTARNTLAAWERAHPPGSAASSDQRAHALFLTGLMATDGKAAEDAFLGVVFGYPSAPHTAAALLRVGKLALAADEPLRATGYLERMLRDFPRSPNRAEAHLWLARAQRASQQQAAACTTASSAAVSQNETMTRLLEEEKSIACGTTAAPNVAAADVSARAVSAGAVSAGAVSAGAVSAGAVSAVAGAAVGNYAVQAGAFRARNSADALARVLRDRNFDARVVQVPDSDLFRVRVGRFTSEREARTLVPRIRETGYAAIVVSDVHREQR